MKEQKSHDEFGDRMKLYEGIANPRLLPGLPVMARLDGRGFHAFTKHAARPFSEPFHALMVDVTRQLVVESCATVGYTQSDEISVLLTDFSLPTTSAWFDGNLQKMVSVSASIITAEFNRYRLIRNCGIESGDKYKDVSLAYFDARAFTIPDRIEVMNHMIWRNQDCSRNSVSMVAQHHFSHKELQGKSTPQMHDMLHDKGINWATDFTDGEKNGRLIVKEQYLAPLTPSQNTDGKIHVDCAITKDGVGALRSRWVSKGAWKFTEDKDKLLAMIPKYE